MGGGFGIKRSTGQDYPVEQKRGALGNLESASLEDVERAIVGTKKSIRKKNTRLDILRSIARDRRSVAIKPRRLK